jgi:hypothetical protein
MSAADFNAVRVRLAGVSELFRAPEPEPFSGWPESASGIDRMLQQLRPHAARPVRVTLELPAAACVPGLEADTRAALHLYCDARIAGLDADGAAMRREGFIALGRGLLFMALCMLGAKITGEPAIIPTVVGRYLSEGFVIAGWVALWHPLDLLLYQRWPLRRDRALLQSLETGELEFVAVG